MGDLCPFKRFAPFSSFADFFRGLVDIERDMPLIFYWIQGIARGFPGRRVIRVIRVPAMWARPFSGGRIVVHANHIKIKW